jgi:hypothetical protein
MGERKTLNTFIAEANKKHNNKYDYSLVDYKNCFIKVKLICKIHGVFEQRPTNHLQGNGCPFCSKNYNKSSVYINRLFESNKTFINRSNEIHNNKYDYSLVDYKHSKKKVKITCPLHGIFEQIPNKHLSGSGCPSCSPTKKMGNYSFINKAVKIHGKKYDYSLVDYSNIKNKIKIICPIHGVFEQRPTNHLMGKGCSICRESKGERKISLFLIENNIKFIPQHTFDNCKNVKLLPFDFYLPEHNICIEYNGKQHYEPVKIFGGEEKFKLQIINDKIKYEFCLNNDINFNIIKYDENIKKRLKNIIYEK